MSSSYVCVAILAVLVVAVISYLIKEYREFKKMEKHYAEDIKEEFYKEYVRSEPVWESRDLKFRMSYIEGIPSEDESNNVAIGLGSLGSVNSESDGNTLLQRPIPEKRKKHDRKHNKK